MGQHFTFRNLANRLLGSQMLTESYYELIVDLRVNLASGGENRSETFPILESTLFLAYGKSHEG